MKFGQIVEDSAKEYESSFALDGSIVIPLAFMKHVRVVENHVQLITMNV